MKPFTWSRLNKQQVGAYAEYFVKMELTLYGFQVYGTEVDDRGIDFVARHEKSDFIEVQVKSIRSAGYVFMQKSKFEIRDSLYLALVLLREDESPDLYLVPSIRWRSEDKFFVSRDYVGLKSDPEWGLNLSKKNLLGLSEYRLHKAVDRLIKTEPNQALEPTTLAVTSRAPSSTSRASQGRGSL